ncbi:MAG TPA: sugar ABC transporter permease [Clostridiaceae bacterium]|nr:sugar ABC transporter permease [Clostridiaceae bacterium]
MTKKRRKIILEFIIFTSPVILLFLLTYIYPFISGFIYMFTDWNGISSKITFVGLENFSNIFSESSGFVNSVSFTIRLTAVVVPVSNLLALAFALILDMDLKLRNFIRTLLFMPNVITLIIIGFMWQFVFTNTFESLYKYTGLDFFNWSWLGDERLAFWSVAVVCIWQVVGFYMVIYISGLQTVNQEVLEASIIDGAGRWQRFYHIILPFIVPAITIALFLSISNTLRTFDIPFVLTKGGPGFATRTVVFNIYEEAFKKNNYGLGSAKAFILFVATALITLIQVLVLKRKEVEN